MTAHQGGGGRPVTDDRTTKLQSQQRGRGQGFMETEQILKRLRKAIKEETAEMSDDYTFPCTLTTPST